MSLHKNNFGFISRTPNSVEDHSGIDLMTFNEIGFREKPLSELNVERYILFVGCSMTEGVGVPENSRYSNLVSEFIDYDTYNISLRGTGIDTALHNISCWINVFKNNPPNHVFIACPYISRSLLHTNKGYKKLGSWVDDFTIKKFFSWAGELQYFRSNAIINHSIIKNLLDSHNIPNVFIGDIEENNDIYGDAEVIYFPKKSTYKRGSDNIHPGSAWHFDVARMICDYLEGLNTNIEHTP